MESNFNSTFSGIYHYAVHFTLLVVLCFLIYSNNYQHGYNLDDSHVLLENSSIRSLKNIPEYFIDAGTSTSLKPNVDYRPVLNITYALNYWMGGYNTWWWHFTQILLHLLCVIGLYFLCRKTLSEFLNKEDSNFIRFTPLIVSIIFTVHPYASGVVNYFSARSSELTATFIFPSIILFMTPSGGKHYTKLPWLSVLFYCMALFTKVEAIAALAVYFLYEVLQTSKESKEGSSFFSDVYKTMNLNTVFRLLPFLVVTIVYYSIRYYLMMDYDFSTRHDVNVGSYEYLLTQTTAWWHYILKWFAPVNLIADDLSYPVYMSIKELPVLLSIGGWVLVFAFILYLWSKVPYIVFLALSGFALITPTSSIAPLAEMVNEHRPYMPLAVLSLSWLIPVSLFWFKNVFDKNILKYLSVSGCAIIIITLSVMTYKRNLVFKTERNYWEDVVNKAPSSRSYVNLGLTFMEEGNYDLAFDYFQKSLQLAPYWHIPHINIAIVYQHYKNDTMAFHHFNEAVKYESYSAQALLYRGNYNLSNKDYDAALADYLKCIPFSREYFDIYKGIATSYAGKGLSRECYKYTVECIKIDSLKTLENIVSLSSPFWEDSLLFQEGITYYRMLDEIIPQQWWIYENIGNLALKAGNRQLADESFVLAGKFKK